MEQGNRDTHPVAARQARGQCWSDNQPPVTRPAIVRPTTATKLKMNDSALIHRGCTRGSGSNNNHPPRTFFAAMLASSAGPLATVTSVRSLLAATMLSVALALGGGSML